MIQTSDIIEPNSVHLGDVFELIKLIPDQSIPLIYADLPYGETSNKQDKRLVMEDFITVMIRSKIVKLSFEQWCVYCIKAKFSAHFCLSEWKSGHQKGLWSHFQRIMQPNGNIVLFAQGHFTEYLISTNRKQYKYDIIWDKKLLSDHLNAKNKPMRQHECMLIFNNSIQKAVYNPQFSEGKPLHGKGSMKKEIVNNNYGKVRHTPDVRKGSTQKYPTTIWKFPKSHPSAAKYKTEKPVPLLMHGIQTFSNEGDTVLDCTCGSGGIGEACLRTGRNYILMDNDPIAIEKTYERLSAIQTSM